jgi:hypothetical protein
MFKYMRYAIALFLLVIPNIAIAYDFYECGGIADTNLATYLIPTHDTIHGITVFIIHPEEADSLDLGSDTLFTWMLNYGDTATEYSPSNILRYSSFGKLIVTFEVNPGLNGRFFVLPHTRAYYNANYDTVGYYPSSLRHMANDVAIGLDSLVNFGSFDENNDGYVDYFSLCYRQFNLRMDTISNGAWIGVPCVYFINSSTYSTNDTNSLGNQVSIITDYAHTQRPPAADISWYDNISYNWAHEFSHHLSPSLFYFPMDNWYGHNANGYWNPASPYSAQFLPTGEAYKRRCSYFTPYWALTASWRDSTNLTVLNGPLYKTAIEDYISGGSLFKYQASSIQYFLVANRQGFFYNESHWPSKGVFIWHIDNSIVSQSNSYHKTEDLEIPDGLFWVDSNFTQIDPAPDSGLDEIDYRWICPNAQCLSLTGANYGDSGDAYLPGQSFDPFSNPNSNLYSYSNGKWRQNLASRFAVRHINYDPNDSTILIADLLANNYYGQLASSMTWGHATIHKGYAITGDITVPVGETLRILAGTDIYFQSHEDNQPGPPSSTLCGLDIYGTLIAEGTAEKPIRFISSSSQYDSGAAGDWYGIRILSGGKASMNHVEIKYAYNALAAYTPESLGISNSTISWSENCGIYAEGTSSASLNIVGVDLYHPGPKGIDLKNACANLEDVNIDKPNTYGIYYLNDINSNPPPTNPNDTLIFDQVGVHGTGISSGNTSIGILMSSANYPFLVTISELTIEDCYSRGVSLSNADSNSIINAFSINHIGDKGIYVANSRIKLETPDGEECWYGWGISNCFHGIYCYGTSAKPRVRKVEISKISSVAVYNAYGLPYFGKIGASDGYNQFLLDTSKYDIYNYGGDTIYAQQNYWGEYPPRIKAYGKYKASAPLSSRPCGPHPKIAIESIPIGFDLLQNYPNPFNSSTNINFALSSDQFVTLEIFNLLGQKVKTLISEDMEPGSHLVTWRGDDMSGQPVASGIYLYLLKAGDYSDAKQMLLIR